MSRLTANGRRADQRYAGLANLLAARDASDMPKVVEFLKIHKTTTGTLAKVRAHPAYQMAMAKFTRKQTKILTETFRENTIEVRNKIREYADKAPEVLFNIMMDEEQRGAVRISAAAEILDRDGRFAKVSRVMNVKEGEDGAPMLPEDAASEIMDSMKAAGLTVNAIHKKHSEKPN